MRHPVLTMLLLAALSGPVAAAPLAAQVVGGQDSGRDDQEANAYPPADQPLQQNSPSSAAPDAPGRTADAGTGLIGQRQTREEAAPNVTPLGRINSRIANRVQNRIRNRIDRYYDPSANATSPFRVAGDQARTAGTRPR